MKRIILPLLCLLLLLGCTPQPTDQDSVPASSFNSVASNTGSSISTTRSPSMAGTDSTTTTKPTQLIDSNGIPMSTIAQQYGFTKLVFEDDFDSPHTIDYSGTGNSACNWYIDRPYGWSTLTTDDFNVENSVLTIGPALPASSYSLSTYSKAGKRGFTWKFGYAEARIRFEVDNIPTSDQGRRACPAFWGMSINNVLGKNVNQYGELDIMEVFQNSDETHSVYYAGTLHNYKKSGSKYHVGSNFVNSTGHRGEQLRPSSEWHTYGALWTKGYIAWYVDGVFIHSVTFKENELPIFHYRDYADPLPSMESDRNWEGIHTVMNNEELVMILGGDKNWPMQVDWVRIWS